MKRIVFISFFLLTLQSYGQLWFDIGAKGGVGGGFALNKTLSEDSRFSINPGLNYFFGGKIGVNWGEFIGVTFDVDYGGYNYAFNQGEVPGLDQSQTYKYKISYNAINLMPMIRYTKEEGYLELGPQFQMIRNPLIEDAAYPNSAPNGEDYISSRLTGITFGFGGHMLGNEIISLMMGLRMNYVISDITSDSWVDSSFPFSNYPDITEHQKTSPLNVQVVMELNYSLGYIARSTSGCGKRAAFLTF